MLPEIKRIISPPEIENKGEKDQNIPTSPKADSHSKDKKDKKKVEEEEDICEFIKDSNVVEKDINKLFSYSYFFLSKLSLIL